LKFRIPKRDIRIDGGRSKRHIRQLRVRMVFGHSRNNVVSMLEPYFAGSIAVRLARASRGRFTALARRRMPPMSPALRGQANASIRH
jgi:hypothetical protein